MTDPNNGIRAVWTQKELAAKRAHPAAAFGLDVVDNFYTGSGHDMLLKPSTSKGGHGFDLERPAMHASLIFNGSAMRTRGSLGIVKMTRIGPTLASILGVGMSPSAARPLNP